MKDEIPNICTSEYVKKKSIELLKESIAKIESNEWCITSFNSDLIDVRAGNIIKMNEKQKINLICRMAGNIFGSGTYNKSDSVNAAFSIYQAVSRRIEKSEQLSGLKPTPTPSKGSPSGHSF